MGREAKGKGFEGIKGKEGFKKMKDIFMCLLMNLKNHGSVSQASMDDSFIKIALVDTEFEYEVCVFKKEKKGNIDEIR